MLYYLKSGLQFAIPYQLFLKGEGNESQFYLMLSNLLVDFWGEVLEMDRHRFPEGALLLL